MAYHPLLYALRLSYTCTIHTSCIWALITVQFKSYVSNNTGKVPCIQDRVMHLLKMIFLGSPFRLLNSPPSVARFFSSKSVRDMRPPPG